MIIIFYHEPYERARKILHASTSRTCFTTPAPFYRSVMYVMVGRWRDAAARDWDINFCEKFSISILSKTVTMVDHAFCFYCDKNMIDGLRDCSR